MRRVDPKVYTKDYYLNDCTGHEIFKKNYGKTLDITFKEMIKYFKVENNFKVLDIGCGRGELAFYCASKGAKVIGIDYAPPSIKLANLARSKQKKLIKQNTKFLVMDAKKLNFDSDSFDLVILTGFVEHLYPEELDKAFKEIKRVLKKNGKIFIHTAPNKLFNDSTYKLYTYPISTLLIKAWNILIKKNYSNISNPNNIRKHSHAIMHINEPTYFSLNKLFKKHHLSGSIRSTNITVIKQNLSIKDRIYNLLVYMHPISKYYPFNIFFGSDFISYLSVKK